MTDDNIVWIRWRNVNFSVKKSLNCTLCLYMYSNIFHDVIPLIVVNVACRLPCQ